jgi:type III secretion system (T3SS) SseB-like protein
MNARRPRGTIVSDQNANAETQAVLQQLASSTALLPQEMAEDAEPTPEGAVALPVIEQDGTQYVPVFTTPEALSAAGADPEKAVEVPIAQLAAGWPAGDLWLAVDPASAHGLTLPPELVRALPGLVGAGPN